MVPVAPNHLDHILTLDTFIEIDVLDVRHLLHRYQAKAVRQLIQIRVVGIMSGAQEIMPKPITHIVQIVVRYPVRDGISQPRVLLVSVGAVNTNPLTVQIQRVVFDAPLKPAQTEVALYPVAHFATRTYSDFYAIQHGIVRTPKLRLLYRERRVFNRRNRVGRDGFIRLNNGNFLARRIEDLRFDKDFTILRVPVAHELPDTDFG